MSSYIEVVEIDMVEKKMEEAIAKACSSLETPLLLISRGESVESMTKNQP